MRKTIRTNTKELGELRTSQLITSFGVGAIVDFRDETAILGGADDWYRDPENDKERVLRCHNLEKILDKEFFVKPKCDKKQRAIYKRSYSHDIGAYRFPSMLYCPSCTRLCSEKELAGLQKGELRCPRCGKRLVPSRFVVVCRHGHIDDFPYSAWVHRGNPCAKQDGNRAPKLKPFNINGRTNLGSLMVSCEDCGMIRSMQEAFVPDALASVYQCAGRQPWLERDDPRPCTEKAAVRMRASTGIYMPVNISALNIPPWSTNVSKILLNHLDAMEGKNDASLLSYIQRFICPYLPGISVNQILATYKTLISDENQKHPASLRELYEEHSLQGRLHRSPEAFDPRGKHCYQRRSLRSLWRQRSLGRYVGRHLTKTKEMLDDMHKRKIDMADEIFVINVGGYFGESTLSEIEYANATGKAVRYLGRQ